MLKSTTACTLALTLASGVTALALASGATTFALASGAMAANYDKGASDDEIKFGVIVPLSGPASAYGSTGTCIAAYSVRPLTCDREKVGRRATYQCFARPATNP